MTAMKWEKPSSAVIRVELRKLISAPSKKPYYPIFKSSIGAAQTKYFLIHICICLTPTTSLVNIIAVQMAHRSRRMT